MQKTGDKSLDKKTEALQAYFYSTLSMRLNIRPWKRWGELPIFLGDFYNFYETSLLEHPSLLMVAKEEAEVTPAMVRKHWEQVQKKWGGLCIYCQSTVSAYNRKRLIEHRVPFVVPGNQMYLPDLGIDLREHFRKLRDRSIKTFSPATQVVVIHALLNKKEGFTPSEMARELGYTLMTMTRAFDELQATTIGEENRKGKERWWHFSGSKRDLWEQTKPFMKSPLKTRTWLNSKNAFSIAGLSALSQLSMLNPPLLSVVAVSPDQWKSLKQSGIEELPSSDGALIELEVWNYDPNLFAKDAVVDPFSLYLSLQGNRDERVEAALEEMMEKVEWSRV